MFTRSRASRASFIASLRLIPRWMRKSSAICQPTGNTGLRLDSASWKTIAMDSPRRARRSSSLIFSRSSPLNRTSPPVTNPGGVSRIPMIAWAVTLLPEPDSPSTARVSPECSV